MILTPEVLTKLAAPLDPNRVKHREGSGGRSLSYLEGHDVIRTANEVFGIGGWGYVVNDLTCIGTEPFERKDFKSGETKKGIRVGYRALVMARIGEVSFEEVGYGDAQEYNGSTITPHELASKEAVTDALKRALKNLGDQFGLVLYDKFAPEHNGRNATAPGTGANSSAGPVGARGGQEAVTEPHSPASPAAPTTDDGWTYPFGKHKGKSVATVEEQDPGWHDWFLQNSDKDDIKARINDHRGMFADFQGADDDIPFMPTVDGLGN